MEHFFVSIYDRVSGPFCCQSVCWIITSRNEGEEWAKRGEELERSIMLAFVWFICFFFFTFFLPSLPGRWRKKSLLYYDQLRVMVVWYPPPTQSPMACYSFHSAEDLWRCHLPSSPSLDYKTHHLPVPATTTRYTLSKQHWQTVPQTWQYKALYNHVDLFMIWAGMCQLVRGSVGIQVRRIRIQPLYHPTYLGGVELLTAINNT